MKKNSQHKHLDPIKEVFHAEKLELPYIPDHFVEKMQNISDSAISSKKSIPDLYNIEDFVADILEKHSHDFCAVGFAGHGASSNALHYYLVHGPLALFVQLGTSGVAHDDPDAHNTRIDGILSGVQLLHEATLKAQENYLIPPNKRLLVVQSDFIGSSWTWVEGTPGVLPEDQWNLDVVAMLSALLSIPKFKLS